MTLCYFPTTLVIYQLKEKSMRLIIVALNAGLLLGLGVALVEHGLPNTPLTIFVYFFGISSPLMTFWYLLSSTKEQSLFS